MKFENNNKEIIKKITNRSLKSNKTRNIFVVIAIVLTTFMLACVFILSREYATHGCESSHELDSALPAALG